MNEKGKCEQWTPLPRSPSRVKCASSGLPLPLKKNKNQKQKTKWHLIEFRGPPFPPSKKSAILENQNNAIFELKMWSISPKSQTLFRTTIFGHNA